MIRISFKGDSDKRVLAALKSRQARLSESLRLEVDKLMTELMARVQRKLSGEVLQTHGAGKTLLASVQKLPTTVAGLKLRGGVTAGGGLGVYPYVHEFGGTRRYEILPGAVTGKSDKKALAFFPSLPSTPTGFFSGRAEKEFVATRASIRAQQASLRYRLGSARGTLRAGKESEFKRLGGIVVARVVHPPAEKRSYMRSSINEMRSTIIARLHEAAARGVGGSGYRARELP
jgi:hypothetical protein